MKEIIKLNFGSSNDNFDEIINFDGQDFHVRCLGANYDFELALEIVKRYVHECDAFALSGFILDIKSKKDHFVHKMVKEIREAAQGKPVLDGNMLRKAAFPWAIKKYIEQDKHFLSHKKVAFYTGLVQWNILPFFDEFNCKLVFGDFYFSMGIPLAINGIEGLETFLKVNSAILTRMGLKKKVKRDFNNWEATTKGMESFNEADIFFISESQLKFTELNDLTGKTVIIDRLTKESEEKIFNAHASRVLNLP